MAELSFTEKNESLVAVLRAGKEIYQQENQNLFVPEVEVAVTTSSSSLMVWLVASRHLETQEHVNLMENVFHVAAAFQRLIYHFKQCVSDFEQWEQ